MRKHKSEDYLKDILTAKLHANDVNAAIADLDEEQLYTALLIETTHKKRRYIIKNIFSRWNRQRSIRELSGILDGELIDKALECPYLAQQ